MPRETFTMTEDQLKKILAASKPVPYIIIGAVVISHVKKIRHGVPCCEIFVFSCPGKVSGHHLNFH